MTAHDRPDQSWASSVVDAEIDRLRRRNDDTADGGVMATAAIITALFFAALTLAACTAGVVRLWIQVIP